MLEIIILFKLCGGIGRIARAKGRKAVGYQFMLVALWLIAEFTTALACVIALTVIFGENEAEEKMFLVYLAAILGAAIGAFTAFTIVKALPEVQPPAEKDAPNNSPRDDSDPHDRYQS